MRFSTAITFVAVLVLLFNCDLCAVRGSQESFDQKDIEKKMNEARLELMGVFNAALDAERTGANVEQAVKKMNQALNCLHQAEDQLAAGNSEQAFASVSDAMQLSEETMLLVKDLKKKAATESYMRGIVSTIAWVALIVVCVSIVFLGRRWWKPRLKKFIAMKIREDASGVETKV